MKKTVLLILAILGVSVQASAMTCSQLEKISEDNKALFNPYQYGDDSGHPTQYAPYQAKVIGTKGYRAHFHTAPASQCKIKNVFIIPKDVVNVNYSFDYENQEWLHVTYWGKNAEDTSGWMKAKDLTSPQRAGSK